MCTDTDQHEVGLDNVLLVDHPQGLAGGPAVGADHERHLQQKGDITARLRVAEAFSITDMPDICKLYPYTARPRTSCGASCEVRNMRHGTASMSAKQMLNWLVWRD